MKLKNKLILIFILFACFVIFNNSDCFGAIVLSDFESSPQKSQICDFIANNLDSYYDSFFVCYYQSVSGSNISNFYTIYLFNSLYDEIVRYDYKESNRLRSYYFGVFSDCSITHSYKAYSFLFSNDSITPASNYPKSRVLEQTLSSNYNKRYHLYCPYPSCDDSLSLDIKFRCNRTVSYFGGSGQVQQYLDDKPSFFILFEPEPETTKQDIFQLNLTDKNFNDALHTFTLNIDENFVNYSEITDLIENNNKYCIYVTDYTRLLTFSDNSFNATLEGGSYLLSGYIDFLVSDNAYFYFSPHYNRIKVCSGDYRGQDMSTYTKRYFFNLVYSDDSDDTYFTILDDNGLLWTLSDYTNDGITSQSDFITDVQNSYFIGSNQTIYYANEDTNYILDSLTNSIYYGKDRGADERVYNFGFSGGNTKEFYLNDASFDNNVLSQNQIITDKSPAVSSEETFEPVVIHDESSGNSSVIPQDSTTYTYPANTVTDETTSEEDATHRQNERTSYTSTDSNDDSSNWSIWDFVKGIFGKIGDVFSTLGSLVSDLISGLVNLFIPTAQQWDSLKNDYSVLGDTIQSHLPFVSFIRTTFEDAQNTVVSPFDFLNITMPSFSFFGGNTEQTNYVNVRDAYEPYRIQIRSWLVLIVYGVAFVYIVKHVSDYGATQYANLGLEALQSGNRLERGKGD